MNILVTGGAGFIGSNFIKYMLDKYDYKIVNYDKLTYAGNLENLRDIENSKNYVFVKGDTKERENLRETMKKHKINVVVNFAAESHVDRSILGAEEFIETNVKGTHVLLELAKDFKVDRFVQISTDEVYGDLGETGKFREDTALAPNNPYSASKAAGDLLCRAFFKTHELPVIITRCSNNYGPYQFPEKLIPLMIKNALEDKELPVYGDGKNIRDWIFVLDHCSAIDVILHKGKTGEVYNIGGESEKKNIDIVRLTLKKLGKSENLIRFIKDRPGHDRRYAMDTSKIKSELGWMPKLSFDEGIDMTIKWYVNNKEWAERCTTGEYMEYYKKNYENKFNQRLK
jgi:dTDP-glucose 4,6-dehydratase